MVLAFISDLPAYASVLLIICLIAVCLFEAINGFHDTANAVATVIYTKTLTPNVAVVWSGIMNFLGVFFGGMVMASILSVFGGSGGDGGIAVAMGIVKLMPLNEMMASEMNATIALVLAVLLSAIIWNLGTWYYGIPCSSSHTLIGALLGAGFAFSTIYKDAKVNWSKAGEIGSSLLISPLFGFSLAILLMFLLRSFVKNKAIFKEPDTKKPPPFWIRLVLILTCTLVSFFHGSNDGQKGVGLLLVVMMAFMPLQFAFNPSLDQQALKSYALKMEAQLTSAANAAGPDGHADVLNGFAGQAGRVATQLDTLDRSNKTEILAVRKSVQELNKGLKGAMEGNLIQDKETRKVVKAEIKKLSESYEFAPIWLIVLISICLGVGTMIGWKRIVVTIGEKIGKSHLTYAQGASAELCAAATIGVSTGLGLPVSTTHVLSSGIAGTMVAQGGVQNLQRKTILNIALAWLLTLPVSFLLAGGLFYILRAIL
ncbi:MAG: inorganic phosphate transporter [Saprospiraceae bacterium]|nr:inorganic phosphate transporter [Saprospiraceae bacterium]